MHLTKLCIFGSLDNSSIFKNMAPEPILLARLLELFERGSKTRAYVQCYCQNQVPVRYMPFSGLQKIYTKTLAEVGVLSTRE